MTRYQLPDIADLIRLGDRHERAITGYAETSPAPNERENSLLQVKSAVDRALRTIREGGARHAAEEKLRSRWAEIADSDLWLRLSRSLAVFIADDFHEVYMLPNALETQSQLGDYFDIGELVRAVTTPQQAYALTLSANGWNLWRATATTRAEETPARRRVRHRRRRGHQPRDCPRPRARAAAGRRRRQEGTARDVRQAGCRSGAVRTGGTRTRRRACRCFSSRPTRCWTSTAASTASARSSPFQELPTNCGRTRSTMPSANRCRH